MAGLPLGSPGLTSQVGYFLRSFDLGRALGASIILAACVCCGALLATRQDTVGWLALLSIGALLPLALVGHAAGSATHQASVDSLALHLVGVSVWVGGLAALVLLAPQLAGSLPASARRYSTIAGWCFALVAVSGLLNAWLRLGSWAGLATPYGALVCVKAGALLVLGFGGWLHRRSTLARLDGPGPARLDFLRLAGVEVLLMAATVGVAVALSRSAPPGTPGQEVGDRVSALLGFDVPEPLTPTRWLTTWSIEPAWAVVCLARPRLVRRSRRTDHAGGITVAVATLRCLGGRDLLLLWCTSGALGGYGRLQLSVLMAQHVTMMMVVPMLLVLGAPATLALRSTPPRDDGSRGPREWLVRFLDSRALSHLTRPVAATSLFVLTPVLLAVEPVLRVAVSTHAGHLVAGALLLGSGYLFAWVLMGLDPGAGRVGGRGAALMLLAAVGGQLALATWLATGRTRSPPSGSGQSAAATSGSALAADQRLAAVLVLLLTAVVTLVMGISRRRRRRRGCPWTDVREPTPPELRTAPGVPAVADPLDRRHDLLERVAASDRSRRCPRTAGRPPSRRRAAGSRWPPVAG